MKMSVLAESIYSSSLIPCSARDDCGTLGENIWSLYDVLKSHGDTEIEITFPVTATHCASVLRKWSRGEEISNQIREVIVRGADAIDTFDCRKQVTFWPVSKNE